MEDLLNKLRILEFQTNKIRNTIDPYDKGFLEGCAIKEINEQIDIAYSALLLARKNLEELVSRVN